MPEIQDILGGGILLTLVGLLAMQIYRFRAQMVEVRVRLADVEAEVADIRSRCREHHADMDATFKAIHESLRLMAGEHVARHRELLESIGRVREQVATALAQFAEHVRRGA